jgi:hypothetical protein
VKSTSLSKKSSLSICIRKIQVATNADADVNQKMRFNID